MTTEIDTTELQKPVAIRSGGSDTFYGLGLIGAWVYFIGRATTNQERFKGFLKGLVWPAYLVYKLFVFLEK